MSEKKVAAGNFLVSLEEFKSVESVRSMRILPDVLTVLPEQHITLDRPVDLVMKLVLLDKDYLVRGNLTTSVGLSCSRCLSTFSYPLSIAFHNIYRLMEPAKAGEETEITDQKDLEISIVAESFLDIRDIVQEQVILNIPIKPLCDEQCKGLCSSCGRNMNEGACTCNSVTTDPRFAVLRTILQDSALKNESGENIDKESSNGSTQA